MNSIEFTKFLLCCYGITAIIVYGGIFSKLRAKITHPFFNEIINCSLCTGFWVSLFMSFFFIGFNPLNNFIYATAGSGVSWLLCSFVQFCGWGKAYFELKVIRDEENNYEKEETNTP